MRPTWQQRRVVYQHDDSNTYSDNIVFPDGGWAPPGGIPLPLTIIPVDDEPPMVTANAGLSVTEELSGPDLPFVLSAMGY